MSPQHMTEAQSLQAANEYADSQQDAAGRGQEARQPQEYQQQGRQPGYTSAPAPGQAQPASGEEDAPAASGGPCDYASALIAQQAMQRPRRQHQPQTGEDAHIHVHAAYQIHEDYNAADTAGPPGDSPEQASAAHFSMPVSPTAEPAQPQVPHVHAAQIVEQSQVGQWPYGQASAPVDVPQLGLLPRQPSRSSTASPCPAMPTSKGGSPIIFGSYVGVPPGALPNPQNSPASGMLSPQQSSLQPGIPEQVASQLQQQQQPKQPVRTGIWVPAGSAGTAGSSSWTPGGSPLSYSTLRPRADPAKWNPAGAMPGTPNTAGYHSGRSATGFGYVGSPGGFAGSPDAPPLFGRSPPQGNGFASGMRPAGAVNYPSIPDQFGNFKPGSSPASSAFGASPPQPGRFLMGSSPSQGGRFMGSHGPGQPSRDFAQHNAAQHVGLAGSPPDGMAAFGMFHPHDAHEAMAHGGPAYPAARRNGAQRGAAGPAHGPGSPPVITGCMVKLRGLPYSAGVDDIVQFFSGFHLDPDKVHVVTRQRPDGSTVGSGIAMVEFSTREEANRAAVAQHRQMMGERYIECMPPAPPRAPVAQAAAAQLPRIRTTRPMPSKPEPFMPALDPDSLDPQPTQHSSPTHAISHLAGHEPPGAQHAAQQAQHGQHSERPRQQPLGLQTSGSSQGRPSGSSPVTGSNERSSGVMGSQGPQFTASTSQGQRRSSRSSTPSGTLRPLRQNPTLNPGQPDPALGEPLAPGAPPYRPYPPMHPHMANGQYPALAWQPGMPGQASWPYLPAHAWQQPAPGMLHGRSMQGMPGVPAGRGQRPPDGQHAQQGEATPGYWPQHGQQAFQQPDDVQQAAGPTDAVRPPNAAQFQHPNSSCQPMGPRPYAGMPMQAGYYAPGYAAIPSPAGAQHGAAHGQHGQMPPYGAGWAGPGPVAMMPQYYWAQQQQAWAVGWGGIPPQGMPQPLWPAADASSLRRMRFADAAAAVPVIPRPGPAQESSSSNESPESAEGASPESHPTEPQAGDRESSSNLLVRPPSATSATGPNEPQDAGQHPDAAMQTAASALSGEAPGTTAIPPPGDAAPAGPAEPAGLEPAPTASMQHVHVAQQLEDTLEARLMPRLRSSAELRRERFDAKAEPQRASSAEALLAARQSPPAPITPSQAAVLRGGPPTRVRP